MVASKFEIATNTVRSLEFIENPSSTVLASSNERLTVKGQFVESSSVNVMRLGNGGDFTSNEFVEHEYADAPNYYNLLAWFDINTLSHLNNKQRILSGSSAWTSSAATASYISGYSDGAYGAGNWTAPRYERATFGSKPSILNGDFGYQWLNISPHLPIFESGSYTLAYVFQTYSTCELLSLKAGDAQRTGKLVFDIGVNRITTVYSGSGAADTSQTFSGSATGRKVAWVTQGPINANGAYTASFYENKFYRGNNLLFGPRFLYDFNAACGFLYPAASAAYLSGSLVEICLWTGSLTQTQIASLFDGYFNRKYNDAGFYTG